MVYSNTPGPAYAAPESWPGLAGVELAEKQPTVLMFAHPRCPCTVASLHELERLVAQVGGRISGAVFFYRPLEARADWEKTELWRQASAIPGFRAVVDVDGETARAFGAATSGHIVVYDSSGRLVYSGGLTAARAHEGDNRGRDAVRAFANDGLILEARMPVYGCPIRGGVPEPCEDSGDRRK